MKATVLKITIKIAVTVCLLLAGITAQAALPQGKWVVEQVSIEKNTDGKIENAVYKSAAEVQSYIPCPQEWEIKDSENIILHFPGNIEETKYSLEGDQLTIPAAGAILEFNYTVSGEGMTLTMTYNYDYNQPVGNIVHIIEKWTVVLNNK